MEFTVDDLPEPATEPGDVAAQAGADVVTERADATGGRVGDGTPAVVLRAPVTSGFLLTAGVGLALLIFWMTRVVAPQPQIRLLTARSSA